MSKENNISDMYLNMIFPFTVIYICVVSFLSITSKAVASMVVIDGVILTVVILGFLYGVLAIIKELKEYGKLDTLIYWKNKLFKKRD